VVADIPGIIEGAAEGRGLGLQFLRHIERTKVLALLIAADSEDIPSVYRTLLGEMEQFDASLLRKPRIVIITKMDIAPEELVIPSFADGVKVLAISSVAGTGLRELKDELWVRVSSYAADKTYLDRREEE